MLLYDTLLCLKALVSSADSKQVYCLIDFSWYLLQSRHNYKRHSILESSKWLMSMVLENIRESNSSILSILLGQAFIFAERPLRAKCVMVTILVRFGNTKQKKTFAATFQFTIKRNAQSQYTHTHTIYEWTRSFDGYSLYQLPRILPNYQEEKEPESWPKM